MKQTPNCLTTDLSLLVQSTAGCSHVCTVPVSGCPWKSCGNHHCFWYDMQNKHDIFLIKTFRSYQGHNHNSACGSECCCVCWRRYHSAGLARKHSAYIACLVSNRFPHHSASGCLGQPADRCRALNIPCNPAHSLETATGQDAQFTVSLLEVDSGVAVGGVVTDAGK